MKIRVLLVDDHNIVREGLRVLLNASAVVEVVGEVADGREAVRKVQELQPEVVVMDIAMPMLNGAEATRQILRLCPDVKVLVLSSYSNGEQIKWLIGAGVSGYVIKASATHELLKAIQAVHKGGAFFSPAVAKEFIDQATQRTGALPAGRDSQSVLTSRETEIWQLVAEGHANKQIADILALSVKTVEKHRQNLMLKLNLHCTASLTRRAVESGIVENQRAPVLSAPPERV